MTLHKAGLWPPWSRCPVEDCKGIQLEVDQGGPCLAHSGTDERAAALQQLHEGRPLDFTAGVPFTPELLAELLAGAPTTDEGRPLLAQANFAGASFQGTADFQRVSFQGPTRFELASFDGDASFREASSQGTVDLNFSDAIFEGMAGFHQARFQGPTRFERARFKGTADFGEASFERAVWFTRTGFGDDADFRDATFARPWEPGPMVIRRALMLDRVVFTEPVTLEVTCRRLSCQRTRFKAGGDLRVADAVIDLQDAEVPAPMIIAWHAPDPQPGPTPPAGPSQPGTATVPPLRQPIVASLERANVATLTSPAWTCAPAGSPTRTTWTSCASRDHRRSPTPRAAGRPGGPGRPCGAGPAGRHWPRSITGGPRRPASGPAGIRPSASPPRGRPSPSWS